MKTAYSTLSRFAMCCVVFGFTATLSADFRKHQDVHSHRVESSLGILGATWRVDSRLNLLGNDPHELVVGQTLGFSFREFYNLTADSDLFTPLIVPGAPNAAPAPRGSLAAFTWRFAIRVEGCATFDYTNPWAMTFNTNSTETPSYNVGLSAGPAQVGVTFPGTPAATTFHLIPFPDHLEIEFATGDAGQGFFLNGGSIGVNGAIRSIMAPGSGRVYADNSHYASGAGVLVDDYTFAESDAEGRPATIRTQVYDDFTCIPTPGSAALFLLSGLFAHRRRR